MTKIKYFCFLLIVCSCSFSCQSDTKEFTVAKAQEREEQAWAEVPNILNRIVPPKFPNTTFNILDYGAVSDTLQDSRTAILDAIVACQIAGGGRVVIPAGDYYSKGPISLLSNVELHLTEGARLKFSDNPAEYLPMVKVRWEGTVCWNYSPLIYAYQQKNIALTGKGTIDGNGRDWSMNWRKQQQSDKALLRQMGNDKVPEDERVFGNGKWAAHGDTTRSTRGDGQAHFLRPTLIELYECQNILLTELTLRNSPFWTVHPVFSQNITIRNLQIFGGYVNDDGIDPDSCEDVLIEGCYIETEDDAISIKAGRDQDAWDRPPSRHIVIRDCRLNSGVNAFCVGSEMSGGVAQVYVEDCHILAGKHGLNFKCNLDRGGQVQKIFLRNIQMDRVEEALFIFRMDYHGYRGNHFPTQFNDFYASNITCETVDKIPFKIVGVADAPIQRLYLHDIDIQQAGEPSQFDYTEAVILDKVRINDEWLELPQ